MIVSEIKKNKRIKPIIMSICLISIILLILFMLLSNTKNLLGLLMIISLSIIIIFTTNKIHFLSFLLIFILINNQFFEIIFKVRNTTISMKVISYIYISFILIITIFERKFKRLSKGMIIPIHYYGIFSLLLIASSILNNINKINLILLLFFFIAIGIYTQILVLSHYKYRKLFIYAIIISILSLLILGFTEFLIGKTFFLSQWTGEERYRNGILRIGSTVGDPNFVCLIILSIYPFLDTQFFKKIIDENFLKFIKILTFIIVLITGSRTGLIVLFINILLKFLYKNKKLFMIGIFALIVIYFISKNFLPFLYNMDKSSNYAREMINQLSLELVQKNPILGIGLGNFSLYSKNITTSNITDSLSTMNTYFYILTGLGLLGLLCYSMYLYKTLKENIGDFFKNYDSFCIIMSVVSWSIMIATLDSLYIVYLWILPAIVICVNEQKNEKGGI